jgi:quercetin dioxygenase-like cupin family protein
MTHFEPYRSGSLAGVLYTFEEPGDGLPQHRHESESFHNIIVLKGAVSLVTLKGSVHCVQGSVTDFDGTEVHTIIALTRATILNLYLTGLPEGERSLPRREFVGVVDASIDFKL